MIYIKNIFWIVFFGSVHKRFYLYLNILQWARRKKLLGIAKYLSNRIALKFGVYISPKAIIGSKVRFPHPTGIVIGEGVRIDEEVVIYQNVTLGGARVGDSFLSKYPRISRNTVVFAGAVIVGDLLVGERCVIGANSVVLKSIPNDTTAVGVPAKYK